MEIVLTYKTVEALKDLVNAVTTRTRCINDKVSSEVIRHKENFNLDERNTIQYGGITLEYDPTNKSRCLTITITEEVVCDFIVTIAKPVITAVLDCIIMLKTFCAPRATLFNDAWKSFCERWFSEKSDDQKSNSDDIDLR